MNSRKPVEINSSRPHISTVKRYLISASDSISCLFATVMLADASDAGWQLSAVVKNAFDKIRYGGGIAAVETFSTTPQYQGTHARTLCRHGTSSKRRLTCDE